MGQLDMGKAWFEMGLISLFIGVCFGRLKLDCQPHVKSVMIDSVLGEVDTAS